MWCLSPFFYLQMNFLIISLLAVGAVSFFPRSALGSSTGKEVEEQPHALPLAAAAEGPQNVAGEIWQEDDREVLIRSERGAKSNGGPGSGKKEKTKRVNNPNSRKLTDQRPTKKPCKFLF